MKKKIFAFCFLLIVHCTLKIENCLCQWIQMNGPKGGQVYSLFVIGNNIWAGTGAGGVFLSTNKGISWIPKGLTDRRVQAVTVFNSSVFAATDIGVYKSTNNGSSWIITSMTNQNIGSFTSYGNYLFAGELIKGMFRSTNSGVTWDSVFTGLSNRWVNCVSKKDSMILAGTEAGLFYSTNFGNSWVNMNTTRRVLGLAVKDSAIYTGGLGTGYGIWKTTNNGLNWVQSNNGIPSPNIYSLLTKGSSVYAGSLTPSFYKSLNNAGSWSQSDNGINAKQIITLENVDSSLFAGSYYSGLFVSNDLGGSWAESNLYALNVRLLAKSGSTVYAIATNGLFASTNDGLDWTYKSARDSLINCITFYNSNIFVGFQTPNGLYKSADNGNTWTQSGLTGKYVRSLCVVQSTVYAGVWGEGYYASSNNGVNWTQMVNEISALDARGISQIGNIWFTGTGNGVYKSTNFGVNWILTSNGIPSNTRDVYAIIVHDTILYAQSADVLSNSHFYKSSDKGNNWVEPNPSFFGLVGNFSTDSTNLFLPTRVGIYVSTNFGITWLPKNDGLYKTFLLCAMPFNSNLLLGTGGCSVWRRSIAEVIGINPISTIVPDKFNLYQNYPNPFNPTTKIKFDLRAGIRSQESEVKLIIYDIVGREIQTLVNEQLQPGTYEVTFDGSNLPSGIYFYKLTAGEYIKTNKMLMIK